MRLTLTVLRCPSAVSPETRVISGGEYSIGRGPANDWILVDPQREISKRHCLIAFRSGQWQVADVSTNGTFLNHENSPIGAGGSRPLRSGDRLGLGAYEIEVEIAESIAEPGPGWRDDDVVRPSGPGPAGRTPAMLDPFADEPHGPDVPRPIRRGPGLPDDFNPFDDGPAEEAFRGPVQFDHSPAIDDAFRSPPAIVPIPEDWELDGPEAKPLTTPPPVPPAAVTAPPPPAEDLMAAFLRGAGVKDARPEDPVLAMEALGAVLRATVVGLRQALMARLDVKGMFRIGQTTIRASGNNPLKFSAGDEDALAALLGAGRRNAMPPAVAVTEALRDMRLHELATMAAMQEAVRALLARFDPASLERRAARAGLGKLLNQGKAQAWDEFVTLHAEVSQGLFDDFDSVFGKTFARAYEAALRDMSEREGRP